MTQPKAFNSARAATQANAVNLNTAITLHQQGRLVEAEAIYKEILLLQPQHFDALQLLAAIALQRKDSALAVELFDNALKIKPDSAEALNNRGAALRDLKRYEQALESYDQALKIKPDYIDALNNRGNVLRDLNRYEDALESYDRILKVKPDHAETHYNRGNALLDLTRYEQALESYNRALKIKPDHADALNNRGNALRSLNRYEEALDSYVRALKIKPGYANILNNHGNALLDLKRPEQALESYNRALEIQADYAEALYNRGAALRDLKRYEQALESYSGALKLKPDYVDALYNSGDILFNLNRLEEALECFNRVLKVKPDYAEALNNRGNALLGLQHFQEALASYDEALRIQPNYAQALYNRGNALLELKQLQAAIKSYEMAIMLEPEYVDAHWNSGLCYLQLGDFARGWEKYEWRRQKNETGDKARKFLQPQWQGKESLQGKTIFLYSEQGFGDTLQFCRYAKSVADLGAHVILEVQKPLLKVLEHLEGVAQLLAKGDVLPAFDFHCPLLSLPLAFKTDIESIPNTVPYLFAEKERISRWRENLGVRGFKVGISWQGNHAGKIDIGRSFSVGHFKLIAKIPSVRLISLQKNEGVEQLENQPENLKVEIPGHDFDSGPDAFIDSAAVISSLDLVITSDTAIAHLAGALGCPTWVALKHVPDWRWMLDGGDSAWYPTMRLFRQPKRGDWASVFNEMHAELLKLSKEHLSLGDMRAYSTPIVPVSWGELIDKITILEIKAVKINSAAAVANVKKELAQLQKTVEKEASADKAVGHLKRALKAINADLWQVEDKIREKEDKQEFDQAFIHLARSVYKLNDKRAEIKRQINIKMLSGMVEEKSYKGFAQHSGINIEHE